MTTPTNLVFREWKKPEVTYELHGWKRDKALAFVIDDKGQPLVLEFVLPAQFNEHDRPTAAFSQLPPTDVTEIRLVPPPCRADQAGAHSLRVRARANTDAVGTVFPDTNWNPSRWELVRLSYDSEILILKPEDDVPLANLLNTFKEEKRREFDERKQEIHALLELVRQRRPICGRARYYAHLVSNGYKAPSADSAAVWLHSMNQERIRLDIDFGQGGYQRGFLQWTPDDARRHPNIRDPFLQSRWAKDNGLDLQQMALERKQIAAWTGMVDAGYSVAKFFKDTLGDGFERMDFPTAPSPATLDMAKAGDLEFGASIRFRVTFANESQETWLTACRRRGPEPHERADFGAAQGTIVTMETIKHGQDKILTGIEALPKLVGEQSAASIAKEREKLDAVVGQLGHKTKSLAETIAPLNKLYSDVQIAEIRMGAKGKGVPDLITNWVLNEFKNSGWTRLPTKGDVFNNCGPGTVIGKQLERAGHGIAKQTFAGHLTVVRRLLGAKGWLADPAAGQSPLDIGKSRKRESHFQPDDRLEDFNQPTPAESAEDRDEERKSAGLGSEQEDAQEQTGDSHERSDAD